MTPAVLGFRPHTYWTAAVAVAGEADAPEVLERRRIDFAAGDERSVYHRAQELPLEEAEAWIAEVRAATLANTRRGLGAMLADLGASGADVRLAVVPIGRRAGLDPLADILKSHSRIHAAEGDFYRDVVAAACAEAGLEVRRLVERDALAAAAESAGLDVRALEQRLRFLGAALGPPWSEDQKLATLAAWSALPSLEPAAPGVA